MDATIIAAVIMAIATISAAYITHLLRRDRRRVRALYKTRSDKTEQPTPSSASPASSRFPTYSAPACVFLAGEHAVMFGHAALYLPLPCRLSVRIEPDEKAEGVYFAQFLVPDPDAPETKKPIGDCRDYRNEIGHEEEQKLNALFREVILPFVPADRDGSQAGFRFYVDSDFSVACGMNGSGAIAACIATAFVECFMDMDRFRAEMQLQQSSNDRIVRLLAWLIENCFHAGKGSGAGFTGALTGREGLHPLVYFPGKRTLLQHRIAAGWPPVAVGDGRDALHRLSDLGTYMFDPSARKGDFSPYDPPPQYHLSLIYSGNPSKTGDVLRSSLRKVSPRHGRRVRAVQDGLKKKLPFDMLSSSVRFHAQDVIENIYLSTLFSEAKRDEELEVAYHELLCEGMGAISILMMNSVLWNWTAVPQLMTTYQNLLSVAGVSNSAIDSILGCLSREATSRHLSDAVSGKITGCGRGGDVVIVTVNRHAQEHDDLVSAVAHETHKPVHFRSTAWSRETWSRVPGVRREE